MLPRILPALQGRHAYADGNPRRYRGRRMGNRIAVNLGADAIGNIDNLVVLNGAQGMEDLLGRALTMGGAGLGIAQKLIATIQAGRPDQPPAPAASAE